MQRPKYGTLAPLPISQEPNVVAVWVKKLSSDQPTDVLDMLGGSIPVLEDESEGRRSEPKEVHIDKARCRCRRVVGGECDT